MTRRDFNLASAMTILSGVVITISACSDDGPTSPTAAPSPPAPPPAPEPPPPTAPAPTPEAVEGFVAANHGHIAIITGAQLTGGGDVRLDIRGNATHPHTVEITALELEQIAAAVRVTKSSSTNLEHAHEVTFN